MCKQLSKVHLPIFALIFMSHSSAFAQLQHSYQQTASSTPSGQTVKVQAASTEDFINSIGVVTHFNYPSYKENLDDLKSLLLRSGIRHIRDSDFWALPTFKALATQGVRVTWLADPALGVVPNRTYWCNPNGGPKDCYDLDSFLKTQVGPDVFDAIETMNEPDGFYSHYKWHAIDPQPLSGDKNSSSYWKNYAMALTRDTCSVIHNDPALRYLKCVAPALGGTSDRFTPGSLYGVVDFGNMHPYPRLGNGATPYQNYDSIRSYFQWGDNPSLNIDEYPYAFNTYRPAFTRSPSHMTPMVVTETGYCTGTAKGSISLTTHAKYMPRLFAEYFRHGIVRTFSYELYDEGTNPENCEANFGLIRHDLTPKPAYEALSSLLTLLKDGGAAFSPGSFSYSLTASSVDFYNHLQYVHDLLLQKSNGDFYLLFWHEISDAATSNGFAFSSTAVDLDPPPPALPVTLRLPANIPAVTVFTYGSNWKLNAQIVLVRNNTVALKATDVVSIVEIHNPGHPRPSPPELHVPETTEN